MDRSRRHSPRHDPIALRGTEAPGAPVTEQRLRGRPSGATRAQAPEASGEPVERRAVSSSGAEHAEFVSLVTQELRQSLQAMLGFTQLMDRDEKEPLPERCPTNHGKSIRRSNAP
jgi:signal transduction histidine kinase